VESWLWKRLWTCRETDCWMNVFSKFFAFSAIFKILFSYFPLMGIQYAQNKVTECEDLIELFSWIELKIRNKIIREFNFGVFHPAVLQNTCDRLFLPPYTAIFCSTLMGLVLFYLLLDYMFRPILTVIISSV
jgi:hypothetical protein